MPLQQSLNKNPLDLNGAKEKPMNAQTTAIDQAIIDITTQTGKYLTFTLADESYGIGILKVKEIIGMMPITPVPRTPDFITGVINLRGKVIPIIDLRLKFSMNCKAYTERTCIIVVEVDSEDQTILIGIIVDTVSEVMNISRNQIEQSPDFGTRLDTDYIMGMAKTDGGVKILLNIDKVLNSQDLTRLEQTSQVRESL